MTPSRKNVALLVAALATVGALALLGRAQSTPAPSPAPAAPAMNHNLVVLDPAHGGTDAGAKLGDRLLEKDVTLAISVRLKTALTAAGFTVVSTRDADLLTPLTGDQRADAANRTRAVACIVIHATASGSGVHLYASSLQPQDPQPALDIPESDFPPAFEPKPWDTAQMDWVRQSLRLEADLGSAMSTANVPVLKARAMVAPVDNLMCPAVAIEVAPATAGDTNSVTDADYQQRLTGALTQALLAWRGHADPPSAGGADPKEAATADQAKAAGRATAAAEAAAQVAAKARANGVAQ